MRWFRSLIKTSETEIETKAGEVRIIRGQAVSGGVAIGSVHILRNIAAEQRHFTTAEQETALLRQAFSITSEQIKSLIADQDQLAADILEFQLALLEDDDMLAPIYRSIGYGTPCDKAWSQTINKEIADYKSSHDATLTARTADLADLRDRVLRAIHGTGEEQAPIPSGAIVIAADLTPSGFLDIDWNDIGGAALLGGSQTSHVSILARARGVNLIVGLESTLNTIAQGSSAILDAEEGTLTLDPCDESLDNARRKIEVAKEAAQAIHDLLTHPAVTVDHEPVQVLVNVVEPERLASLQVEHCDGVGLMRTEFLFRDVKHPDEEQQYEFYSRLLEWANGHTVTIRTLDAGGDKPIAGVTIDGEVNPFLGIRGLRLSFARPEIFRVQLRALARAAVHGNLKVMLPMVTVPDELDEARRMMRAEVADLEASGTACAMPPIGIMVEVPAAAMNAEAFDADFYSIGSNDLIQYVTACSRDNPYLATLADPLNPAVIELIRRTVEAAKKRGVDVSLCGDMASSPQLIAALLDTGLRALSCAPAQIGSVKLAISQYKRENR